MSEVKMGLTLTENGKERSETLLTERVLKLISLEFF